jgi:hypothetical protein
MLMLRLYRCDPRPRSGPAKLHQQAGCFPARRFSTRAPTFSWLSVWPRSTPPPFVDGAQEPVVVVDQPLDRFPRQRLRIGARAREPGA